MSRFTNIVKGAVIVTGDAFLEKSAKVDDKFNVTDKVLAAKARTKETMDRLETKAISRGELGD